MKCAEAWQARQTGKNTRNLVTQIDRDKATFVLSRLCVVHMYAMRSLKFF